jgi:stearoyl-CoA desaturase (delta-9 desaturase)
MENELPRKLKGAILTFGQLLVIPTIILLFFYPPSIFWIVATILFSYAFGVLGWVIGQHRYFTHRQFKTSPRVERVLMFFAVMGTWQSPVEWVNSHWAHHKHSDTELDVHSYKHLGWRNLFFYFHQTDDLAPSFAGLRLLKSNAHRFLMNFKYAIILSYVGLVYTIFGMPGLLYLWLVPTSYAMLSQISIVMNHVDGEPRDCWVTDLFTLGEGNHKYHHDNPRDYSRDFYLTPIINVLERL